MYRIRLALPPDNVTLPPPSRISRWVLLSTFRVCINVMVTGFAPQLKVMTPPAATAATTAAEVQLAAVPSPTTRSGALTFSGPAPDGIVAVPDGFPGLKAPVPVELVTETVTAVDVAMLPAASRATARTLCEPSATVAVFHAAVYGAVVSAAARLAPST